MSDEGKTDVDTKGILPTSKTLPKLCLSDQTILVHGPPKIGKSTLCSGIPGAVFAATEAGLNSLEVFQVPVTNWQEFLNFCKEIAAGDHAFKAVVVDTLDNAFRMCSEFVCAKEGIRHEADLGYGKGFAFTNNEFYRVLNKLALLPYGLVLISHSQAKEVDTSAGRRTWIVPNLPERARQMVESMVDIILYCDVETSVDTDGKPVEKRVMHASPTERYDAGDRTHRLPDVMDLDYNKLVAAFGGQAAQHKPPEPTPDETKAADQERKSAQVPDYRKLIWGFCTAEKVSAKRVLDYFNRRFPALRWGDATDDQLQIVLEVMKGSAAKAKEEKTDG